MIDSFVSVADFSAWLSKDYPDVRQVENKLWWYTGSFCEPVPVDNKIISIDEITYLIKVIKFLIWLEIV